MGLQDRYLMSEQGGQRPSLLLFIPPAGCGTLHFFSCWQFSINQMSTNILDSLSFNLFNISKVLKDLGILSIQLWASLWFLSSVQSLSCVWLFTTPWTAALQASLSITNPRSLLKLMSIKSVMPSNNLILCHPLLLPPSIFTSIGVWLLGEGISRIPVWSKCPRRHCV